MEYSKILDITRYQDKIGRFNIKTANINYAFLMKANLVYEKIHDGIYHIIKNRYGKSDICVTEETLNQLITLNIYGKNPSITEVTIRIIIHN